MRVTNWFKNGSLDAFNKFCIQNRNGSVSIKLIYHSELIRGLLHSHRLEPLEAAGVFLLLTDAAIHPAFYSLDDIDLAVALADTPQ